ncbi:MAG: ABC transporter permease [Candidatus Binatus sp.]|uniref:ABC transporter permease n=1 Tax=Candidatus Binatus sp. TaxID=2811406 RepID=UPI00271F5E04|nr:ABC transporter permease [Candidatus Binatus sp.]MDO8434854.1 ABC transporter permease [Candidatus Binatus sp.]
MAIPLKYNIRSLLVRRISTAMTAGGIALVVAVFVIVMALVAGLNSAIADTGSADNLIVLRKGATTETVSGFQLDQFDALKFLPQIRREANGDVDISPELPVQALMDRIGGGRDNIVVRGVLPIALKVHDKVRIVEGRMFTPSMNEVVVGKGLLGHYKDVSLGSTVHFGRGKWKVVGIIAADGGSYESEIWADIHNVQDDAQRGKYYAAVRLKLAPGADAEALIRRLADDPRINLQAQTETDYYRDQAVVANQMRVLGMIVAVIMAVGAIFGAMNTMYASVSARTTEIGTLRALGFAPTAVMASFLLESLVLAVASGAIGIVLAMPINGLSTTFGNFVTFSTLAFSFRVTFAIVLEALCFAAVMGVVGGWLPARQAMKMPVVDALRSV